jgi:hypothetical protein
MCTISGTKRKACQSLMDMLTPMPTGGFKVFKYPNDWWHESSSTTECHTLCTHAVGFASTKAACDNFRKPPKYPNMGICSEAEAVAAKPSLRFPDRQIWFLWQHTAQ